MKLSIIVPVYNTEKFLRRCLDSIVGQYDGEMELIIVNDGSPDKSNEICREYEKKYSFIKYIEKENGGLSSARNEGLKYATGDYVWFVDSDDYISDNAIKEIDKKIKSNADLYEFGYFTQNGESKKQIQKPNKIFSNIYDDFLTFFVGEMFSNNIARTVWNKVLKRNVFVKNNVCANDKISIGEDLFIVLNFIRFCKRVEIDEFPIYVYGLNENSLMHNFKPKMFDDIKLLSRSFVNFYQGKLDDDIICAYNLKQFFFIVNGFKATLSKEEIVKMAFDFYTEFLCGKLTKKSINLFLSTENASLLGKIRVKLLFFALKRKQKKLVKLFV